MHTMEWLADALCKGKNADFWFPPLEETNHTTYYRIGKSLCFACPVWEDCLQHAQKVEEVWGCWGGLTPQERRSPTKLAHGTIEKYRSGCHCADCKKASKVKRPALKREEFPNSGETYDIDSLIFTLSNRCL